MLDLLEKMSPTEVLEYFGENGLDHHLTAAEHVALGAAWLDENMPGWVDIIDLDLLDIRQTCRCVLGQLVSSMPVDHEPWLAERPEVRYNMWMEKVDPDYYGGYNHVTNSIPDVLYEQMPAHMTSKQAEWMGFDHSDYASYNELADAWTTLVEARRENA